MTLGPVGGSAFAGMTASWIDDLLVAMAPPRIMTNSHSNSTDAQCRVEDMIMTYGRDKQCILCVVFVTKCFDPKKRGPCTHYL